MKHNRRSFSSGQFSGSAFRDTEDADPRVGLVNLADVMLVFACGLMLALVVHWNVNLDNVTEIDSMDEMTELSSDEIQDLAEDMQNSSGTNYTERGVVYEDPTTGQLYLLEQKDSDASNTNEG